MSQLKANLKGKIVFFPFVESEAYVITQLCQLKSLKDRSIKTVNNHVLDKGASTEDQKGWLNYLMSKII